MNDNLTESEKCIGYASNSSTQEYSLPELWQYTYGALFLIISLTGAVGNACVIWICLYYRRMRTITNFFIANLAVADFLLSVMNVPPSAHFTLTQNWIFTNACCTFVNFVASVSVVASVFTMMVISIDRYIAIVHPLKPRMGKKTAFIIIGAIWILSGLFSAPAIEYSVVFLSPNNYTWICTLRWGEDWVPESATVYQSLYMTITYFVPLVILTFAYGRVAMELWGTKAIGEVTSLAQLEGMKSKQKLVKVLIWVMVTFMICWAPYHIWFVVTTRDPCIMVIENISHVFISSYVLAMSNSIYNPIIYYILNNKFRQGFRQIFQWLPCVKWQRSEALDLNPKHKYARTERDSSHHELGVLHCKNGDQKTLSALALDNSVQRSNGKHAIQQRESLISQQICCQ